MLKLLNMKHLTALSLTLSLSLSAALHAQVVWFDPSDQWTFRITSGWAGQGIEQIKIEKDTAVAGVVYKKLLRSAQFNTGAQSADFRLVRQDGKKVYARQQTATSPTNEVLMYDFSLKVGDTMRLSDFGAQPMGYIVTAISSVGFGGQTRVKQNVKWWNLPIHASVQKSTFIEGIGCTEGLHIIGGVDCLTESYLFLDEPSAAAIDGPERIFCSFQSALGVFEGIGKVLCAVLSAPSPDLVPVTISPSLSTGTLRFFTTDPALTYEATLFDLAGRQLARAELRGDGSLHTTYKGSAVVVLTTERGRAVSRVVFY